MTDHQFNCLVVLITLIGVLNMALTCVIGIMWVSAIYRVIQEWRDGK